MDVKCNGCIFIIYSYMKLSQDDVTNVEAQAPNLYIVISYDMRKYNNTSLFIAVYRHREGAEWYGVRHVQHRDHV